MYELWSKESLTDLVACVNHFGGPYEGNFLCCFCPSYYWNRERDIGLSGVIMPFVPCVSCYPVCLATVNPSADKHHSLFSVCIPILLTLSPHTLLVLLPSYPRYLGIPSKLISFAFLESWQWQSISGAKYLQTDYFQANSVFVGSRETGDLLGVELHIGKGSDVLCPQKSSSYTFSVSLFELKFNSFPG